MTDDAFDRTMRRHIAVTALRLLPKPDPNILGEM